MQPTLKAIYRIGGHYYTTVHDGIQLGSVHGRSILEFMGILQCKYDPQTYENKLKIQNLQTLLHTFTTPCLHFSIFAKITW